MTLSPSFRLNNFCDRFFPIFKGLLSKNIDFILMLVIIYRPSFNKNRNNGQMLWPTAMLLIMSMVSTYVNAGGGPSKHARRSTGASSSSGAAAAATQPECRTCGRSGRTLRGGVSEMKVDGARFGNVFSIDPDEFRNRVSLNDFCAQKT